MRAGHAPHCIGASGLGRDGEDRGVCGRGLGERQWSEHARVRPDRGPRLRGGTGPNGPTRPGAIARSDGRAGKRPSVRTSSRAGHSTLAPPEPVASLVAEESATKNLGASDRRRLLALARLAIEEAVRGRSSDSPAAFEPSGAAAQPAAAFVTLHEHGELRGCIGLLRFEVPLWRNVREAAVAAALHDPRFAPLEPAEVSAVELEISVLEPPIEIRDPAEFKASRHGIVAERGMRRALLLPQVATEMGWGEEQMLDAVCRKAGLPGDAWRDRGTRLSVFEATVFGEADPGSGEDGALGRGATTAPGTSVG